MASLRQSSRSSGMSISRWRRASTKRFFQTRSMCLRAQLKELAEHFNIDIFHFTGVLDGIDDSLKGYHNPIDTMDENTTVKIEIDPEKLYYNMVEAKASWLYGLPQWDSILTQERRKELYKEQKNSGTIRRQGKKIYPNDPCPCGSGKKYKKCHMRIDEENELKMYREEQNA